MLVVGNHWVRMYRNGAFQGDGGKALIPSATHLCMVVRDETGRAKGTPISKTAVPRKFKQMIRSYKCGSLRKIMAEQGGHSC